MKVLCGMQKVVENLHDADELVALNALELAELLLAKVRLYREANVRLYWEAKVLCYLKCPFIGKLKCPCTGTKGGG